MSEDSLFDDGTFREEPGPVKQKKRWRDRWLLLTVLGVIALVVLGGIGIAGYYAKSGLDALDNMERNPSLMPTAGANRPEPVPTKEGVEAPPMNIILMGTDARSSAERGRSDVLMLMHINGARDEAYLISFPRDYWVEIPGRGTAKINAAYSWGGPSLTVETMEQLLDLPIDHTAVINFEGFTDVIDALGGVTVYNQHASQSRGYTFPKGEVELTGDSALVFVRERYNLPSGDSDRAERQRDVVKAVVGKLMSRDVLTSPGTFREIVTTLGSNFTVDQALDNSTIIGLGMSMGLDGADDIVSLQAPTDGSGTSSDGQWYWKVDYDQLEQLAAALRNDTMAEYVAAHPG